MSWKIYLRRQFKKTAPDIRITRGRKTVAIIEVKAKAGWMRSFFSSELLQEDRKKFYLKESKYNPDQNIKDVKNKIEKYCQNFSIRKEQMFLLLPSLILVHRKKSSKRLDYYEQTFESNSGLSKDNFILLSKNLCLDLSGNKITRKEYKPTDKFERLIAKLATLTKFG